MQKRKEQRVLIDNLSKSQEEDIFDAPKPLRPIKGQKDDTPVKEGPQEKNLNAMDMLVQKLQQD